MTWTPAVLIERLGGVSLSRRQVRVRADRLGFETLVAANGDRANHPRGGRRNGSRCRRRWRQLVRRSLSGRALGVLRSLGHERRRPATKHGTNQKNGAGTPLEAIRS